MNKEKVSHIANALAGRFAKYEYWQSTKNKEWRWHLKAANGEIVAAGEGYKNKRDLEHGIELLKSSGESDIQQIDDPNP